MEQLTADQLKELKHGDKVYRFEDGMFRKLYYVARIPKCENYLIFCDGTYLTYLFINSNNNFIGAWYGGKYDSEKVKKIMVKYYSNIIYGLT